MVPHLLLAWTACSELPSELARPNRIALGSEGQVFVSDFQHDRIVEFTPDGRFVRTIGSQGIGRDKLWRVTALSVARSGALMIANRRPVSDAHDSELTFELKRFQDGREQFQVTFDTGGGVDAAWIDAIAPGPDPETWLVADAANGTLTLLDASGSLQGAFGGIPRPDAAPSYLVRSGAEYWVVEQYRHRIGTLDAAGKSTPMIIQDDGSGPPSFPSAIALCDPPDGGMRRVIVADLGNHRVEIYDEDGRRVGGFVPEPVQEDQPVQLLDLAAAPDCSRLYLVDSKGNRVLVTDATGAVLDTLDRW